MADLKTTLTASAMPLVPADDPAADFDRFLQTNRRVIEQAIGSQMDLRTLVNMALTTYRMDPMLRLVPKESLFAALIQCAQVGLLPGPWGHVTIQAFRSGKTGGYLAQILWGYKGMVTLMHRSPAVRSVRADVVYEGDYFEYDLGTADLHHRHTLQNRGALIAAYAVADLANGGRDLEVLTADDIAPIRAMAQKASDPTSPWVKWPGQMWKKSAIKRLATRMPLTLYAQAAIAMDETVQVGWDVPPLPASDAEALPPLDDPTPPPMAPRERWKISASELVLHWPKDACTWIGEAATGHTRADWTDADYTVVDHVYHALLASFAAVTPDDVLATIKARLQGIPPGAETVTTLDAICDALQAQPPEDAEDPLA